MTESPSRTDALVDGSLPNDEAEADLVHLMSDLREATPPAPEGLRARIDQIAQQPMPQRRRRFALPSLKVMLGATAAAMGVSILAVGVFSNFNPQPTPVDDSAVGAKQVGAPMESALSPAGPRAGNAPAAARVMLRGQQLQSAVAQVYSQVRRHNAQVIAQGPVAPKGNYRMWVQVPAASGVPEMQWSLRADAADITDVDREFGREAAVSVNTGTVVSAPSPLPHPARTVVVTIAPQG